MDFILLEECGWVIAYIKLDPRMNFDHRLFKGLHRNKVRTQKKLINANELLTAVSNCTTVDEIKAHIQKSIDENHAFEKGSCNPFTKSRYARELEACNKIIDRVKTQMVT